MEHARPPAELALEGGPASRADAWRKWLRQFQVFLKASGVYKESDDVQASLLINLIGPEGYDIYSTFKFAKEEEKDDVKKLIEKYNAHFGTKVNTTMVRFKFFTRDQGVGESIDEYVTALKILSQQCEFDKLEDSLVRDRIVCGVVDTAVRDRLLRTDELTLEKAVKICQANEISTDEGKQIEGVKSESMRSASVDAVWRGRGARRGATEARVVGQDSGGGAPGPAPAWRGRAHGVACGAGAGGGAAAGSARRACAACADVHCDGGDHCAARRLKCFLCGNKGHYKVMCPLRKSRKVYEVNEEDEQDGEDGLYYISTIDKVDSLVCTEPSPATSFPLTTCEDDDHDGDVTLQDRSSDHCIV